MKISVLANLFGDMPLDSALKLISSMGVHCVEIGSGGYPGKSHCNPQELLADNKKFEAFVDTFKKYDMDICALATHGNPLHPDAKIAADFDKDFKNSVLLAEKLNIDTVITFSGCPGDSDNSLYPNWVTCPWPDDFGKILDWQWEKKLVPYWKETAKFSESHNVSRIAFEMHPGFCVYNPETMLKLRSLVGPTLGANFDPSHLIWQGMDPVAAIRELEGAIYHCHAKDTKIDKYNTAKNGVLDNKHYGDELHRSWVFRTVGYGNDQSYWKDLVSNLRLCGYDRVLSIEHEDSLMSTQEGLSKAISFLENIVIESPKPSSMSWA